MIVERLKAAIQTNSGLGNALTPADYAALQALLANPKNLPYLFVGCHGPDPFFFFTKDLNPTLGKIVEIYNDVGDFIREFWRSPRSTRTPTIPRCSAASGS
jgi:hypothetical protein